MFKLSIYFFNITLNLLNGTYCFQTAVLIYYPVYYCGIMTSIFSKETLYNIHEHFCLVTFSL